MSKDSSNSPESAFFIGQARKSKGTESYGSSGSSRQPRVSLFQQAVRNTIIEDITRNRSFHLGKSVRSGNISYQIKSIGSSQGTNGGATENAVNPMSQSLQSSGRVQASAAAQEESKIVSRGSAQNLLSPNEQNSANRKQRNNSSNQSMNESFFADWDLTAG